MPLDETYMCWVVSSHFITNPLKRRHQKLEGNIIKCSGIHVFSIAVELGTWPLRES